ncbi:MAG TPA: hypothetical protein DDY98_08145 [Ruminococcaceae bacterium]|nr:hypothetical protein [Oscillospiraceae bacterium]
MFSLLFRVEVLKKVFAFLTALLMSVGIDISLPIPSGGIQADAVMSYTNNTAGSAAGMISVESNYDGEYEVYWGNEKGEKLTTTNSKQETVYYSEFADVTVSNGKGEKTMNAFLAIPPYAETILLYYGDTLLDTDEVPENKQADTSAPTYTFGCLSDIHFNRYDSTGGDDSDISYPRALNFLDNMGVSLVALSGDLSANGEAEAYESFRKYNEQHSFPVYTCRGNHDCRSKFTYEAWKTNVNVGVFNEQAPAGVLARSDNGFDFVYSGKETNGDIFIFLSQSRNRYLPGINILEQSQLDWLKTQLETYKDKRVYLYFHSFLNSNQGNWLMSEGNIVNDYGFFYPLPYFKGNSDERQFRALLSTYKNVVFFNGHSHWAYSMEKYNKDLNICNYDGTTATMVHISSVGAPRTTDLLHPFQTSNPATMSEGIYVTAYPNYIVTNAVDFVNGEILAYATYRIAR